MLLHIITPAAKSHIDKDNKKVEDHLIVYFLFNYKI